MELDIEMSILMALEEEGDDMSELFGDEAASGSSDSDDSAAEDVAEDRPRHQVPRIANRKVNSIDAALDDTNYDSFELPRDSQEYKVILEKGTRNNPEKSVTWKNQPGTQRGRQNVANVITGTPGVNRAAREATTAIDAWECFFSDEMLNLVLEHTNQRIRTYRAQLTPEALASNKYTFHHETSLSELQAFIGLMYARGLNSQVHLRAKHLFSETGHTNPLFGAAMSKNRYLFLLARVSFDDSETRKDRWKHDRYAGFREMHSMLNQNCANTMTPDDFLTLDETLYPTRARISMKQYNRNKPAKYGLLFRSMNAARYPYTFWSVPYCGKPTDEPTNHYVTRIEDLVKYIIEEHGNHTELRGRNLTTDRLYTSLPLAKWMLTEKGMTIVGTLQANRKGIPDEMKKTQGRDEFSYQVLWEKDNQNITLHSYVVRTKSTGPRNVLVMSTMKPILGTTTDDRKKKPAIMKLYDFTKGGTDIVDQRAQSYTTKAQTNRWTVVAFYFLLDTCRVNASTVFAMNTGEDPRAIDSYEFGWKIVAALVHPYIAERSLTGLTHSVKRKIYMFTGEPPKKRVNFQYERTGDRRRCRMCLEESYGEGHKMAKQHMPKMTSQCQSCGDPTCKNHVVYLCETCFLSLDN